MRRDDIPLFPLNAVLFPGSRLRLRVFEPRYFDMLRECGRRGIGFGVVCILDGVEAGPPAIPAAYGSLVRIEDFGHTEDGLLGLTVEAEARFHAHRTRVRDNGLVVADLDVLEEPAERLAPQHALLGTLLLQVLEHTGSDLRDAPKACFDDAAWVGWRLAELLPLDLPERQRLMELDTPGARLDHLLQALSGMERPPR